MRISPAILCALLVLGGYERRSHREPGAKLERSDKDTVTTTAEAGDTAAAPRFSKVIRVNPDPSGSGWICPTATRSGLTIIR